MHSQLSSHPATNNFITSTPQHFNTSTPFTARSREQPFKLSCSPTEHIQYSPHLCSVEVNQQKISGAATTKKTGASEKPYE
jgi:hypothetical protein